MAQNTITDLIIPILLVSALITGGFSFISMNLPSSNDKFNDYNLTYSKFAEIKEKTDKVSTKMQDSTPESGVWGLLTGLINTGYEGLKILWDSITLFSTLTTDLGFLPIFIPAWFIGLLSSIVLILFVLGLIALYFRWNP